MTQLSCHDVMIILRAILLVQLHLSHWRKAKDIGLTLTVPCICVTFRNWTWWTGQRVKLWDECATSHRAQRSVVQRCDEITVAILIYTVVGKRRDWQVLQCGWLFLRPFCLHSSSCRKLQILSLNDWRSRGGEGLRSVCRRSDWLDGKSDWLFLAPTPDCCFRSGVIDSCKFHAYKGV